MSWKVCKTRAVFLSAVEEMLLVEPYEKYKDVRWYSGLCCHLVMRKLLQQLDQLTSLVNQLLQAQAAHARLPGSPPQASALVLVTMLDKCEGNTDHCKACGLYIEEHPDRLIAITGHAHDWATALWVDDSPYSESAWDFQAAFKEIFDDPTV